MQRQSKHSKTLDAKENKQTAPRSLKLARSRRASSDLRGWLHQQCSLISILILITVATLISKRKKKTKAKGKFCYLKILTNVRSSFISKLVAHIPAGAHITLVLSGEAKLVRQHFSRANPSTGLQRAVSKVCTEPCKGSC